VSWVLADELVHSVATECHDLVWRTLTAPYRDVRATAALFAKIDVPQTSRVTLLRGDPEELLRSSFASPIALEDVRGQMDVFSVLEKENTRRRVIGWPRRWNKVERRIYDDIAARHGRVLFASATTVRDRVVFPFARSLDIKKYFQCFFMPRAVAAFFAFPVADAFLVPATVPTGAVGPPLFSQVLAVSAALAAIRLSDSSQSVVSDVMIDNIRLCASDHDALLRTWFTLLDILHRLGITVGDTVTQDDYAFLGMRFLHAASASERSLGPIVSIAEKTALKLRRARAILVTRSPIAAVDLQAIFGVCIFGSIVVGYELFRVYFVFKFMRKLVSKIRRNADLARRAMVWPAIVDQWCAWIDALLQSSFTPRPSPTTTWTVYTDASDVGCGVVVFLQDRTLFWARAWSPAERLTFINERELLAVRWLARLLRQSPLTAPLLDEAAVHLYIDNTAAAAWLRRRRGHSFIANAVTADVCTTLRFASINYIESARNVADAPSRAGTSAHWQLPSGPNGADGVLGPQDPTSKYPQAQA
jgi:hypothetical protein